MGKCSDVCAFGLTAEEPADSIGGVAAALGGDGLAVRAALV